MQSQITQPQTTQSRIKWTVDDYHRMIESEILLDKKVELLNGEVYQMPPEGAPHSYFGGSLADQFRRKLGNRALVRNAIPITLSNSEPEPDIAVVTGDWETYRYRHPYSEDVLLAVEVSASSLEKDLTLKRQIYAAAGIQDYWILALKNSRLLVFREPQDGDYQLTTELQQGTISPLAFPDVSFAVSQLLPSDR
ncbi:MAG: hypothetical protein DCF15_11830 [Phormidesmis priestleyi]|uniref:Putative restriction endonuclease domain-containing protein n=1 Tax=Phormidesmis priestleyi TaxID=268141 RepID=A0A2W4XBD4_9CYAN|nr:MAG: hypothetical protein DCF15_11830 [Phormidesmis priestleyi]